MLGQMSKSYLKREKVFPKPITILPRFWIAHPAAMRDVPVKRKTVLMIFLPQA